MGIPSIFITFILLFLPLYYLLPDISGMTVKEVMPGTLFSSILWTLFGLIFHLYTSLIARYALYGLLGAVLLVLLWFYVGGYILLLGAILAPVLAERIKI